jgi:hypothetical protein
MVTELSIKQIKSRRDYLTNIQSHRFLGGLVMSGLRSVGVVNFIFYGNVL